MAALPTYPELLERYRRRHGKLVEPRQGWDSLAEPLWLAYSMSIKRAYYDVGTYVNKPGDHGGTDRHRGPPAWAFDLRRTGWLGRFGFGWVAAQVWARYLWRNHRALAIEYVIVGRKIISREKPYWHPLTTGSTSHDWHIHCSGHWPGR